MCRIKKVVSFMLVMSMLFAGAVVPCRESAAAAKKKYQIYLGEGAKVNLKFSGNKLITKGKALLIPEKAVEPGSEGTYKKLGKLKLTSKTKYKIHAAKLGKKGDKYIKVSKKKMMSALKKDFDYMFKHHVDIGTSTITVKGKTVVEMTLQNES